MKSRPPVSSGRFRGVRCLTCETKRYACRMAVWLLAVCFGAASLHAQPSAGSITTHYNPASGISVIDAAGNVYTISSIGPITAGAAQVQPGGGLCIFGGGGGGMISVLGPCPDV